MKTIYFRTIFLLIVSFFLTQQMQAQEIEWAVAAHGAGGQSGTAVHSDGNYVYQAGNLEAPATFGPGEARETVAKGSNYLARHTASGQLSWVTTILSSNANPLSINAIDTDASGNIYLIGDFSGTGDYTFGDGERGETVVSAGAGLRKVFVAKYTATGNLQWVRVAGTTSLFNVGNGIAVDNSGNSYIAGSYQTEITFGADGFTPSVDLFSFGGPGDIDMFIVKYDTNGNLDWAKTAGGDLGSDRAYSIDLDSRNNVYFAGDFTDDAFFGLDVPASSIFLVGDGLDGFLARYSPDGVPVWVVSISGVDINSARDLANRNGKTIVAGLYHQTATFGSTDGITDQLVAHGTNDYFLARYNRDGELEWVNGYYQDLTLNSVRVGHGVEQQSCVLFNYGGSVTFAPGEPSETTLNSPGDVDAGIACYSGQGVFQWVEDDPTPMVDGMMPNNGDFFTTGGFEGNKVFGPGDPHDTFLSSAGSFDIYLAKYSISPLGWIPPENNANESLNISSGVPDDFVLSTNYPNPFNPTTTIRFALPEAADVPLKVFDLTGKEIANLVSGTMAAGAHEVNFEAGNLPSGLYLYRLSTPKGDQTRVMSLIK